MRVIGLVNLIYMLASALLLFGSGFAVMFLLRIILWAVISLWLLRGAPQLVNLAYPGDGSD